MLILQVPFYSVKVESVDDLSVITILLKVLLSPVKFLQFSVEGLPEAFFDLLVDVDVIDSDAGLTAVHEFPKEDSIDGWVYLCRFVHYDRTLAA